MNKARKIACNVLYRPTDSRFGEKIRKFQGCPTLAITPKGRIYVGWYSGGTREPHMENYNLLVYSDDDGQTW
ncbi:MAG: sialidase family protein, partial [Candidatus Scatosoma sp.]